MFHKNHTYHRHCSFPNSLVYYYLFSNAGGMATKLRAAQMATAAGCEMVIANGQSPEVLYDVAAGKRVGTRFLAKRDEA